MTVRTRFSPSPTGFIHLGNVRTALFSALYAQKNAGQFVLRIEDTDVTRSEDRYTEALQVDLQWLGIHWQEGPEVGGDVGPYWQSQRQSVYERYYAQLENEKKIYPCFCTDQELNLARKIQLSQGQAPRYAGTCKKLTADEIAARRAAGKQPAWRFAVPVNTKVEFEDIVKGPQSFATADIGDFIIRRADGTPPFLFCNAIDDATMKITHVLRGEDHLANTPRQLLLLQTLKLHQPLYGHLSLIVGDDGAPLSKRHGSFSLQEMRHNGYLPIALANYLARLGHSCENQELLDFGHLAMNFNLDRLSKSPARFDRSQLMYWQKNAVQVLDDQAFWEWLGDDIQSLVPNDKKALFIQTVRGNVAFPQEALQWANIIFLQSFQFDPDMQTILSEAGPQYFATALTALQKHGDHLKEIFAELKQALNISGKKLFMPMRVALTNQLHGPELPPLAQLMGTALIEKRLQAAAAAASVDQSHA